MKRAYVLLAVLGALGCQQKTTAPAAQIEGSLDVALVGDLLFVTAANNSELRALDLTRSPRDFLRAPNPLEPLSIPVIDRPQVLARDLRYADEPAADDGTPGRTDQETSGPYLYVLGAGGAEVSVVHAARTGAGSLTEVLRIKPFGSVSAMAAIGPQGARSSRLFLAVSRASGTDLMEYELPAPEALAGAAVSPRTLVFIPDEWVNAMVVVPVAHGQSEQLAVATRRLQGRGGQTVLLDPETRRVRPLAFPGPMRLLATHAASAGSGLRAGRYLWGALDEDACGGTGACKGLIAVDLDTDRIATRNPKAPHPTPMPVLGTGAGLPTGLTLATDASLNLPGLGTGEFGVLGVVTTSVGVIAFFDGERLRHVDVNYAGPGPTGVIYRRAPTPEAPAGASLEYRAGPIVDDPGTSNVNESTVVLADGAAQDEVISIVYQGLIPDLSLPTQPADGARFLGPAELLSRARVGDRVLVADEVGAGCDEVTVVAVEPGALVADRAPNCARRARYVVRSGGELPYVVFGSSSGYLGRTRPSDPAFASERNPYFNLPPNPDETKDLPPLIQFQMGPEVPAEAGARFDLDTQANFAAFGIVASPNLANGLHFAGRPAFDRAPFGRRSERLFVAFPAANGILGVVPMLVERGENRAEKLEFYR